MIPGLSGREMWMLVGMIVVAILASIWNYYSTKWGLNRQHEVELWKFRKPVLLGVLAGLILWCWTQSGSTSPLWIIGKGGSLSHEEAAIWALVFGYSAEKIVALTINKKSGKISEILGKL